MTYIGERERIIRRPKPNKVDAPIKVPDWPTREKTKEPIEVPNWPAVPVVIPLEPAK